MSQSLTLDEAIQHCHEVAESLGCSDCADEHIQLAEWLKELKHLRERNTNNDRN